ncbi:hypothetical protein [Leuconostoc carnosum]|uniref:hypothetical protein n=1 Tax=Leuconostoc carnosum TaxID=1252 RepID=UPI001238F709|nr:hypothetical protein [Leuconostoc carnosum]KAA8327823.1 hypothetical protein FE409_07290 [Leuconostoc carnosum]KAA8368467.1 hypothetical protein FE416_01360 [Leuconostoc carnosum]KAA8369831.1 hypothetical protein FE414_07285 [Leuconostoc carnosum]KAA8372389.1 hypothetical protein FE412_07465 [Leuconostoc carnosum]KAA8375289.1 hypothetical protein FE408_07345 [Leuconostoc carnosum]
MTTEDVEVVHTEWVFNVQEAINREKHKRGIKTNKELADMLNEGTSQFSRMYQGGTDNKSKQIRQKVFTLFNIRDV